jgi:hypothetical protein
MARKKYRRKDISDEFEAEAFLIAYHRLEDTMAQLRTLENSPKWTDMAEEWLIKEASRQADFIIDLLIEPVPGEKTNRNRK